MQKSWKMLITLVLALMMLVTAAGAENVEAGTPSETAEVPATTATTSATTAVPAETTATPTVEMTEEPTPAATETPAPTDAPTETPTAQPTAVPFTPNHVSARRGTWIALNISMRNLTDERANASMKMAQFLLARSVADDVPVGVYFQREKSKGSEIYQGEVSSAQEWDALMETLEAADFSSSEEGRTDFKLFMQTINGMDLQDVDVWVLATKSKSTANLEYTQNTERMLNESGMMMHFLSFQKDGESLNGKEKWWLYEQILNLGTENFEYDILDYQSVAENPIPMAMELFGLNLLAPCDAPETAENGDILWQHTGRDTLLVLDTGNGGISVVADEVKGEEYAFPIVMEMSETQSLVLLRNVTPGTYRIVGKVNDMKAAYHIQDATLTLENPPADNAPMSWHLEEQKLVVQLELPEMRDPEDMTLKAYVDGTEIDVKAKAESTENGLRWTVTVPSLPLGSGHIRFVASTNDAMGKTYAVESPAYPYVVVDRPLELADPEKNRAELICYYNVPGVEDMPVKAELAQYFHNPDGQTLEYQYAPGEFTIEDGVLIYQRGEDTRSREWNLRVTDGESEAVDFYVAMKHVDFLAEVQGWKAQLALTAIEERLQKDVDIIFSLPADAVKIYSEMQKQYAELPEKLEDALQVDAVLIDSRYPDGYQIPVTFTAQEDGSLVGALKVPAYSKKEDHASLTFHVTLLGHAIEAQEIIPECTLTIINDAPKVAADVSPAMKIKADIHGAPGERIPLTLAEINAAQKKGAALLPDAFVPEALFEDDVKVEGLTVTIKVEPAALVKLMRVEKAVDAEDEPQDVATDVSEEETAGADEEITEGLSEAVAEEPNEEGTADASEDVAEDSIEAVEVNAADTPADVERVLVEVEPQSEGVWVLDSAASGLEYELQILDKGTVTMTIFADDGENVSEQEIVWTFKVRSAFDTAVLIGLVAAVLLVVTTIVLLILRQVNKPSFARMNSVAYVCVCLQNAFNPTYAKVPMSVYGKKETDLAHLVIAGQQTPAYSMPIDVLADVAIQPGKRGTFRLVLGKRAENLTVDVGGHTQSQRPVIFAQEQEVRIFANGKFGDENEVLHLQIMAER